MRQIRAELDAAMQFLDADPRALRPFNIFGNLRRVVSKKYGAQAVTNAWLKMRELVMRLDVGKTTLRVFCNAELPGAFVSALNHYARTRHPEMKFEWAASSLFPSEGAGALGDTYGLYSAHPERWVMDADMRGDLTRVADVRAIATRALRVLGGKVDVYTSDVGIDVSPNYGRQEELTAHVHLGQIVAGLLMLRTGGTLIAKTFTFTRPFSVALLERLGDVFQQVRIDKPAASRPTNSEVYIVCTGYLGSPSLATELLEQLETFNFETLSAESKVSAAVAAAASSASAAVHGKQVEALTAAQHHIRNHRTNKYRRLRAAQEHMWCEQQRMTYLPHPLRL